MKKLLIIMISLLVLLAGCQKVNDTASNESIVGIIALSVNPKLEVGYDKDGKVLDIQGKNEDGKEILDSYRDYAGKDVKVVLNELITEINKQGYFIQDIDGYSKDIIIQVKAGSKVISEDYLKELEEEVNETIKELNLASDAIGIDEDDYDDKYVDNNYISLDKAQEIALKKVGFTADSVQFLDKEYDLENGKPIYEIEFTKDGVEYEVDIDATNGSVIKCKQEAVDNNDDTDDDDLNDDDDKDVELKEDQVKVSLKSAKEMALKKAGITDAKFEDSKCVMDDGKAIYDLEFVNGNIKYDVDIDANTGEILDIEIEDLTKEDMDDND